MAQTPRGGLYGPPSKGHHGVCVPSTLKPTVDVNMCLSNVPATVGKQLSHIVKMLEEGLQPDHHHPLLLAMGLIDSG